MGSNVPHGDYERVALELEGIEKWSIFHVSYHFYLNHYAQKKIGENEIAEAQARDKSEPALPYLR